MVTVVPINEPKAIPVELQVDAYPTLFLYKINARCSETWMNYKCHIDTLQHYAHCASAQIVIPTFSASSRPNHQQLCLVWHTEI